MLPKTFPDSFILHREEHPLNFKRVGVCICYKIYLPLKVRNFHYLQECFNFEKKTKDKLCNFIMLCRSPKQCQDDFESFVNNLEEILDSVMVNNSTLTVVLSKFNAKSSFRYNQGITTLSMLQNWWRNFRIWIKNPHTLPSYIDLIFTT